MKILVTGGTGFIGSYLTECLKKRGNTVICVAKDKLHCVYLQSLGVEVTLGDLNNGLGWDSILDGVEMIYHLAGVTRARKSQEYYEGNYIATKRFLDVCKSNGTNLKRFVHVSSLAAVGPSLDGQPVNENTQYHPVSHYGKSKMLGELEVLRASCHLPITIIRPSAVYGPRERDMYEYFRIIRRGLHPLIGFQKKLLNLIHLEDVVDGILLAADSQRAIGKTFFLGSEEQYSTEEIGNTIAAILKKHPLKIHVPHPFVLTLGVLEEIVGKIIRKPIFFNIQKAKESIQSAWTCSIEKAKNAFGFHPRLSLVEGMFNTFLWYRSNGWL